MSNERIHAADGSTLPVDIKIDTDDDGAVLVITQGTDMLILTEDQLDQINKFVTRHKQ